MIRCPVLPAAVALTLAASCAVSAAAASAQEADHSYESTYSIITRDPDTGELGMAVQSRAFAVGYRTWTAKGGLAVFAHQASSNPYYGRLGMEMLSAGLEPQEALDRLVRSDEGRASRQVAVLDIHGRSAAYTGEGTNDWKGHKCGIDYCAQGNILAGPEVVDEMARVFEASAGQALATRMMAALDAAQAAGGDRRGMQSAAMFIVQQGGGAGGYSDVTLDLRVNDHPLPLVELRRLLTIFRLGALTGEANRTFEAGQHDRGLEMMLELAAILPDRDALWTAVAGMNARMGRTAEALEALGRAVELNPDARGQAVQNPNFESIRSNPAFVRLVGGG